MFRVTLKSSLYYFELMKSSFDIVFMGHFARDTIISPKGDVSHSLGGGVTFGTLTAHKYDTTQKIGVFSEIGKDFNSSWLEIFGKEIHLEGIGSHSEQSTHFSIEYFASGGRKLTLESKADPLQFEYLPRAMLDSNCYVISSIANEVSFDFIKNLVDQTNAWVGIDIQGFIRDFLPDGSINVNPLSELIENIYKILNYCGDRLILKASDDEINYIANNKDVIKSTQAISEMGDFILCTTLGPQGSLIKRRKEKMIHIPAFTPDMGVIDETGAGDCYLSAFLSEYIKSDYSWEEIKRCGYIASSAASFSLEHKGPYGFGSKQQVQVRLQNMDTIPSPFHKNVKYNNF